MSRLLNSIARLPDTVAAILLAMVSLLVVAQVLVRYVFSGSLVWSEELTRLLFVWMVMIAAARAEPMRITLLVDLFPRRVRALVHFLGELLVFALTLLLAYGAWGMIDLTEFDTYTALGISVRWLYSALLVGSALWLLGSVVLLRRHFLEFAK